MQYYVYTLAHNDIVFYVGKAAATALPNMRRKPCAATMLKLGKSGLHETVRQH